MGVPHPLPARNLLDINDMYLSKTPCFSSFLVQSHSERAIKEDSDVQTVQVTNTAKCTVEKSDFD